MYYYCWLITKAGIFLVLTHLVRATLTCWSWRLRESRYFCFWWWELEIIFCQVHSWYASGCWDGLNKTRQKKKLAGHCGKVSITVECILLQVPTAEEGFLLYGSDLLQRFDCSSPNGFRFRQRGLFLDGSCKGKDLSSTIILQMSLSNCMAHTHFQILIDRVMPDCSFEYRKNKAILKLRIYLISVHKTVTTPVPFHSLYNLLWFQSGMWV